MYDQQQLCDKIREIYPDIGECGIDVQVEYDEPQKSWVVNLRKDNRHLKTYLEPEDADACMSGKQCVALGIEIAQLKDYIQRM